ncbi:uncharacterized protein BDR25DRAFT_208023, partial [Lindgomyces ingoldianus]
IVGLIECSTKLLYLISCIYQIRDTWEPLACYLQNLNQEVHKFANLVRPRLQRLNQEVRINADQLTGTTEHARITLTSELYRTASLLYLHQVVPDQLRSDSKARGLVSDGLGLVDRMEVFTSPWPMFLLASNVCTDVERRQALAILNTVD